MGSPGSRPRSFCTCQVLRPRRAVRTLRWCVRNVLPSALETASAPGDWLSRLNGWPMPDQPALVLIDFDVVAHLSSRRSSRAYGRDDALAPSNEIARR